MLRLQRHAEDAVPDTEHAVPDKVHGCWVNSGGVRDHTPTMAFVVPHPGATLRGGDGRFVYIEVASERLGV
eukprot:504241-Prymnesium_polylepis.1